MTTARATSTVGSMVTAKVLPEVADQADPVAVVAVAAAAFRAMVVATKATATSVVAEAKDHLRLHRRHNLTTFFAMG